MALCEGNCKKPVYTMHKWWARRLGVVFRMLLLSEASGERLTRSQRWSRFYSSYRLSPGFTVLDPFLGGGTSLIEAAKLGATCYGYDIDPVACFVSEMELSAIPPELVQNRYDEIERAVGDKIKAFYRSRVGSEPVDVIYYFWVDRVACPHCHRTSDAHPTFQIAYDVKSRTQTVVCPHCSHLQEIGIDRKILYCAHCALRTDLRTPPLSYGEFVCPHCSEPSLLRDLYKRGLAEPRLLAKDYMDASGSRGFAEVSAADRRRFTSASKLFHADSADLPLPDSPIPFKGRYDRRPLIFGYRRYHELFNARQLYCLGLIAREIAATEDVAVRKAMALAFSHSLAANNMFCSYAFGYRRLTPLFSVHAYRKISRPVEGNVWGLSLGRGSFSNCVRAVIQGLAYMCAPYELKYGSSSRPARISITGQEAAAVAGRAEPRPVIQATIRNQSSENMREIPDGTVDVILSDPPYYDNLPYSELADFYHVWLRRILGSAYVGHGRAHTPMQASLFAGKRTGDRDERAITRKYTQTLSDVLKECHRVAKQNAHLIFTYHHRSATAWACLGTALLRSGFRARDVFPVRSEGRSGLHNYDGSIKWDSVFVCEKGPRSGKLAEPTDAQTAIVVREALDCAAQWRQRIKAADLEFAESDYHSFACSVVLRLFSDRGLHPGSLLRTLTTVLSHLNRRSRRAEAI